MSIASLQNFGNPGLGGERTATLQPVLTNRFRAVFYNFGPPGEVAPYDLTRGLKRFGRPTVNFNDIELWSYLSVVHIPQRLTFNQGIPIDFYEDIDNQVMWRVWQQISKQHNYYDGTAYRAGQNCKFEVELDVLAGGGSAGSSSNDPNILQRWEFDGCYLATSNFAELNYETVSAGMIAMTMNFDNVTVFDQDGNRLGDFDHAPEINGRVGVFSTSIGEFTA